MQWTEPGHEFLLDSSSEAFSLRAQYKLQWVPFGNPGRITLSQHGHGREGHTVTGCVQLEQAGVKKSFSKGEGAAANVK